MLKLWNQRLTVLSASHSMSRYKPLIDTAGSHVCVIYDIYHNVAILVYLSCIGPDDYTSINTDLIFNACDHQSCINIVITEDCLVEISKKRNNFQLLLDRRCWYG